MCSSDLTSSLLISGAEASTVVIASDRQQIQKPQLSPMLAENGVTPLLAAADADIELAELAAGAERASPEGTSAANEKIARIEPGLVEGFIQPSWVNNIAPKSASRELGDVGSSLGRSAARRHLQSRVVASLDWLRNSAGSGYTVQFMSGETSNLEFAESFLQILDDHDLMADSYVCMSSDGRRSYWPIKYGNFAGLSLAQDFIDTLPPTIYAYKPFAQNMSSVECNSNNSIAALILE